MSSNIRISEFPRSGGTWLSKMLSELFHIPFPQKSLVPFVKCVEHAHYPGPFNKKTIVMIRDGRDVMTSSYFHFLYHSDGKPEHMVDQWRKIMEIESFDDVEKNIERFIIRFSERFNVGGKRLSWSDHTLSIPVNDPTIHLVKYEELLCEGNATLTKVCEFLEMKPLESIDLVLEKYSFKNITNRQPGQESRSSFYRKGISGDWKNYFNEEAVNTFDQLHGHADEGVRI